MKIFSVKIKQTAYGFSTKINQTVFQTIYPKQTWNSVPKSQREEIAQTASYIATRHLPISIQCQVTYEFPPPKTRLFADYGFFYSMTEAPFEFPNKKFTTPGVLKSVYNSDFAIRFTGIPKKQTLPAPKSLHLKNVCIPMSFGKDSLLTFALSKELGFTPKLIFVQEPSCTYQNKKKMELAQNFSQEFGDTVTSFIHNLGNFRQPTGLMWGWDMLLLGYTTLLLPFVYQHKPIYFFWSNEKSTNEQATTSDGYIINSTHEQSVQWTLHLSNFMRLFNLNTTVSSILEPIHELLILSILHKRYPQIAKYQLSCDGEITKHRWCGNCFECARTYLFFVALGIDPKSVGLMDNMFAKSKRDLFYLFSDKKTALDIVFQSYPERLLAFYLAYNRGVTGYCMDEFRQKLLPLVLQQKKQLFTKYLAVHESFTMDVPLSKKVTKIYIQERNKLMNEINSTHPTPGEKSL